jgi:dephospho-CoA kinase
MKIIGLTGGIGSGKSTVAGFLAELGAIVLDADKIGHEILEMDSDVRQKIVEAFGEQVLNAEGRIDRKKLAEAAFKDRQSLIKLNLITHPFIYHRLQKRIDDYRQQGVEILVIDAPLLIEAGWATRVNEIWVTIAPRETIIERLKKKGMPEEDIQSRMNLQIPPEDRMKVADVVINTDITLPELKKAVADLWGKVRVDTNRC